MRADLSQGRRRRACIGRTQPRPAARERTNHRKPRVTQPENENALAFPFIAHLPWLALFQTTKAGNTKATKKHEGHGGNPSDVSVESIHAPYMAKKVFFVSFVLLRVLCVQCFGFHQRSFSVESPNSTSIIVMIQKRTTTWFSFQPFNS